MTYRPQWLSEGYEDLTAALDARAGDPVDFDVVIVGSGYGGAVAAARLAGARENGRELRVCVLERGREYVPGTFPRRFSELPGHVRFSRGDEAGSKGRRDGLFDIRIGNDVSALVGNGLGGGSLINASVAERAHDDVFEDKAWPAALRRDLKDPKDPNSLEACYARAEAMLEVRPAPADHYAKYFEFEALGMRLCVPRARPAAVARHFKGRASGQEEAQDGQKAVQNGQGVWQKPCIECGDCVTGCNVWAKNTLPMNYLARARRSGALLYTNVTVSRIERASARDPWQVWFCPTAEQHPPARRRAVRAAHVILAAGTFGSTEILMRSRSGRLRFSACLGKRFSTNGDMISVLYGQSGMVNAAPEETTPLGDRHVGPTITGVIETRGTRAERVLIEELAIPGALRRIFEEVITTGALPVQLGRFDRSRHGPQGTDPAAVDREKVRRSQIFAAMGDDGAAGRLVMVEGWERADSDGAICVEWPDAAKAGVFERQDKILSRAEGLGALYLRNPLWMPLPRKFTALFSGPRPSGKLFTVHPLGGCPMGDDAENGVVDDLGRVFDPPDKSDPRQRGDIARTHDGLLVLDGSIVPAALGINPLLTIAALAERAVAGYATLRAWSLKAQSAPGLAPVPEIPPGIRRPQEERPQEGRPRDGRPAPVPEAATAVRFAETMTGDLEPAPDGEPRKLALEVVFGDIRDIARFLREAPHEVKIESATLTLLEDGKAIASAALGGKISWMERGRTRFLSRTIAVFFTWMRLRARADLCQRWREQGLKGVLALFRSGGSALAVCSNAGEVRYLRYDLELKEDFGEGAEGLKKGTLIKGLKTFKYAGGGNPWRQLSELAIKVLPSGGGILGVNKLKIDFEAFFRRFAVQLQITEQRDQPSAIMDLASLALFMARIVFKAHFWSFGLPEYEKFDPERARRRLPGKLNGLTMRRHDVRVTGKRGPLVLILTHYWRGKRHGKQPVLLLHGFGASGAQFAHAGLEHNLVRHLAEDKEFDVWVAELRTSIALPSSVNQWTLDDVATEDIPALVKYVLGCTKAAQLDVVAHCIGSAMFCTAVLAGRLQDDNKRDLVRRAVLLQVGPLITLSAGNVVRGRMAAALRRYMLTDHVDSSVDDRADWVNALIDRLLATYPYDEAEAKEHLRCPPWEPKTHIANCNRSAAVFGRLFQHENLDKKTLDLLGDLLGHTNLTTFEQTVHYAFLERLTDYDATNSYVNDENVKEYFNFPVKFIHGKENDVFDPETTKRSQQLLLDVFGAGHAVRRKVIEGYGHLDPLIGQEAHLDVFPEISDFLKDPALSATGGGQLPIDRPKFVKRPLIGPVLGWLTHDPASNARRARIWCRTDDEQSFGYFLIAVVRNRNGKLFGTYKTPLVSLDRQAKHQEETKVAISGDVRGEVDLLGVIDVPLPAQDDDYEIVIVSAHAATQSSSQQSAQQVGRASSAGDGPKDELLLDAELLDYQALHSSRPRQTEPLPERYGEMVLQLREGWTRQSQESGRARRACDAGYDQGPDSVLISKGLLEAVAPKGTTIRFAVASCRYPASRVDREQADAMFGRLRCLLELGEADREPPSLLVLAGDQIYADATAGMFDPKGRRERFNDSYREAWTAPNAREVLRRIPTYMMLDDHEVDDNWHPDDRFRDETREWGETAFREYQLAHSPRGDEPEEPPYHYDFEAGGFGFFVCDTRTGREGHSRIMRPAQFDALKEWLKARKGSDRPKFVVSPSVVVPFLAETEGKSRYAPRSDGWDGFPDSQRDLFSWLAGEGIGNVVFLCGDPHISMVSGIDIARSDGAPLRGACIIASPLYAPFPFANADPREFLDAGEFERDGAPLMRYALQPFDDGHKFVAGDSFTLVTARQKDSRWQVNAEVHLRDGTTRTATVPLD